MKFKEKSKQYSVLFKGAIAFSVLEFSILGNLDDDDKKIIDVFIKIREDFEFARKYVGGYSCEHTDEHGQRKKFKNYDFGPYPIDLLELNDYKAISIDNLENKILQMLTEYRNEEQEVAYFNFLDIVKGAFKGIKSNSTASYQLLPPKCKYNDLSSFQLSSYLCGFSINRTAKILTVIQIDDD